MLLHIAIRNIRRNKKRTLITMSSVFFAVFFAMFTRSMQIGTFDKITENVVSSYTGHIQIQTAKYKEDPILNNSFLRAEKTEKILKSNKNIKKYTPRLESFALISSGNLTKGVKVNGINPELENNMTKISKYITTGKFLIPEDKGIIIGNKLADFLKVGINDTLILLGQGFHSVSAAGKYPVRGIFEMPSGELNRSLAYITLKECQDLYSAENRLTSYSVLLYSSKDINKTKRFLTENIKNKELIVSDWSEILFELKQLIESKSVSSYVMLGLLYMIVGFGVFGTVVMMTSERRKEFAVLISIGMKKSKLIFTTVSETVLLGFSGLLLGFLVSLPLIKYFVNHPIKVTGKAAEMYQNYGFAPELHFSLSVDYMLTQIIITGIIVIISTIYPIINITGLNPVKAIKN